MAFFFLHETAQATDMSKNDPVHSNMDGESETRFRDLAEQRVIERMASTTPIHFLLDTKKVVTCYFADGRLGVASGDPSR